MSVEATERIHEAHKNALGIVKSSSSLVEAVSQVKTNAPYWIDATTYPPRKIRDPHERKIKMHYLDLVRILTKISRAQLRGDSKCFTQVRVNGPYRSLLGVVPSAHFGAWDLGKQIENSVSEALRLSGRAKEHLFLPCLPRNSNPKEPPPDGRYSLKSPNWLEKRIKKHFKELSEIGQQFQDAAEWEPELEWEYSRAIAKGGEEQGTLQLIPDNNLIGSTNGNGKVKKALIQPSSRLESIDTSLLEGGRNVILRERHQGPIVLGKTKQKLSWAQYNVVKALLESGDAGLTKDQLETRSGHGGARGILKLLAKKDPDWNQVIHFAGITGGRYRIK